MLWSSAFTAAAVVSPATFVRSAARPDRSLATRPVSVDLWPEDSRLAAPIATSNARSAASRPSIRAVTTFFAASRPPAAAGADGSAAAGPAAGARPAATAPPRGPAAAPAPAQDIQVAYASSGPGTPGPRQAAEHIRQKCQAGTFGQEERLHRGPSHQNPNGGRGPQAAGREASLSPASWQPLPSQ